MSVATEESKKSVSKASQSRSSWGFRFLVAVVGAAISFWLASRQNVHNLPPLPTLKERLWFVAPTLFEGAVGLVFLIWIGLLFREVGERATPKIIGNTTATEVAKKRRWTAFRTALFVVYVLVTIPSFGGPYFQYLWPGYPQWISHAARPIFDVLTVLGAFVSSSRRRRNQKPQPGTGYGDDKGPWLDDRQRTFIAIALLGVAAILFIHHAVRNLPPSRVAQITVISALVLLVVLVALLKNFKKPEQNASQSEIQQRSLTAGDGTPSPRKWSGKVAVWVTLTLMMVAVFSPIPRQFKTAAFFAPIGILVIWGVALSKLKLWTYGLTRKGETDRALEMDRRLSRFPGYGSSLAGPILFNAGRYAEVRDIVRPLAFDQQGNPHLTSMELYTYALALENDGMQVEAQKLLEAAVEVPQRTAGFHVALATCLLDQKKDAERARELLELAMATPDTQSTSYGRTSDHLMRLARYAWALAACGRREQAEAQIEKAFASSNGLKDRDLAGLHYFAGEAWRSLREWRKARTAFDEALRLSPDGPAATGTKKALAKMREESQG
jgi:hypothetical protein